MTSKDLRRTRTGNDERRWRAILAVASCAVIACSCQRGTATTSSRVVLVPGAEKNMGLEIMPRDGQLPYCIVVAALDRGVTRLMTSSEESVACPANQAIDHAHFRFPYDEGKVTLYIVFSDQPVPVATIMPQMVDAAFARRRLTAMDLSAPGQIVLDTIDVAPTDE